VSKEGRGVSERNDHEVVLWFGLLCMLAAAVIVTVFK
jgi:hypothetical protein